MYWRNVKSPDESADDVLDAQSPRSGVRLLRPRQHRSIIDFIDLVWTKARFNLKSEANRNYLSYAWWIIEPVAYMMVFYLVFGVLMQRGGPGFIAYLLTGLIPFQWFAKTVNQTANSIIAGRGLMNKVRIFPLFFPLVGIVQNLGKQFFLFIVLFVFLVLYGISPTIHWLAIVPIIVVQILVISMVSCCIAMLIPFVRDLINLVPTGVQFVMFSSGVFFKPEKIPEEWRDLFFINPMANLLHQYRLVFLESSWPDWSALFYLAIATLILLSITLYFYKLYEGRFARVVLE